MHLVVQIGGALLVLAAFVLAQLRLLELRSYPYVLANLVGAGALAVDAWRGEQWGFLLLEGVWALVSAWSLFGLLNSRRARGRAPTAAP